MLSKEVVFPFDVAKVYQICGLCKCLGRKMKNIFCCVVLSIFVFKWEMGLWCCMSMACALLCGDMIFSAKRNIKGAKRQ
jgi:hypothetical protein